MPFDPNYASAFGGVSLPQIDAQRRQNALGQLDLQATQQKVQGMMNPNATPEQLARSGNVDVANSVAQQQQVRQQNAMRYAGTRLLAVSQSQDPATLMKQLAADPNFGAAAESVGLPHPSQIDNFEGVTPDQLRQQAANLARILGATPPDYTLAKDTTRFSGMNNQPVAQGVPDTEAAARLAETARHNRAIEGGKDTGEMDPETLSTAAAVVAANPARIRDYASYGLSGQKNRNSINNAISQRLKDSGMTASDLIQLRARAAAQPANIVKLTQQNAQIQQAETLARANGQRVLDLIDLVDQTGIPLVEGISRSARAKAGGVDAAELASVLNSFQIETARLLSGNPSMAGVISDSARNDIQHIAPGSMSAAQAKRIINRLFTEMDIRQAAAQEQLQGSTSQTTVLPQSGAQPNASRGQWSIVPVQ